MKRGDVVMIYENPIDEERPPLAFGNLAHSGYGLELGHESFPSVRIRLTARCCATFATDRAARSQLQACRCMLAYMFSLQRRRSRSRPL